VISFPDPLPTFNSIVGDFAIRNRIQENQAHMDMEYLRRNEMASIKEKEKQSAAI
jgi:hypothetical protein